MTFLLTLLFLFSPVLSQATTYYVSTTGSNANNGTSEETPFATIAFAVTTMVAGDTTYVRGGTYNESGVRFRTTGTQAAPIKLLAYQNELPILSCTASNLETNSILIRHNAGLTNPMGWITIDGLKIQNCNDGIKGENIHNSIFTHLWLLNNDNQGVLITGAHDNIFAYSIVQHSGDFLNCTTCTFQQGFYASGKRWQIHHNVFVDNLAYGVQQNGSSSANNAATVPDPEFRGAQDWVISDNTFAYQKYRAGIVVWGSTTTNFRIENNIFYENGVTLTAGSPNGVDFVSATGVTGGSIRNNHFYASGSGAQASVGSAPPTVYTNSGNVVNVSAPAFVDGGSNTLPASPDFRLTASAPVNIARVNEFSNNATLVVGAFKTIGTPTANITTDKITVIAPMSTATPIGNLSTAGVTISCPSTVCPGSPVVSTVTRTAGTDAHVEVKLTGITSNACLSHADAVTISYNSSTGTWTGNDNIGPAPGLHQKVFSFTNLPVVNACTGSGPPAAPSGVQQYLTLDGNANDSSGNANHGTATGGSYVAARTGQGFQTTNGATNRVNLNFGSGTDPSTTSFTLAFGVNVTEPSATRTYAGSDLGSGQRFHIGTYQSTWGLGIQTSALTTTSDLAVTTGYHLVVVQVNSTTDTATLCVDGVTATTGSGVKTFTSYTLASDISIGLPINFSATNGPTAIFDEVRRYSGVESCASLWAAWNAGSGTPVGTLRQAAIRFQGVVLGTNGSPHAFKSTVKTISVPRRGGAVILFQVKCDTGTDCDQTAFKLVASKNGSVEVQQVPPAETAYGTWMYGISTESSLNTGIRSTSLDGACTMQSGATQVTADQVPSLALVQNTCTVLAYVVRVDGTPDVDYFDYKLQTQAGLDLPGGYDEIARIRIINYASSGVGF